METILKFIIAIGVIFLIVIGVRGFNNRDRSYNDYDITSARYHVEKEETGVFTTKVKEYEYLDVTWSNGKKDILLSQVIISDKSFARVYNNDIDGIEIHMTQEDYVNYVK